MRGYSRRRAVTRGRAGKGCGSGWAALMAALALVAAGCSAADDAGAGGGAASRPAASGSAGQASGGRPAEPSTGSSAEPSSGSSAQPSTGARPEPSTGTAGRRPAASAGCDGGVEPLKPGRHTLRHDGRTRTYLLALPRQAGPRPVLLNLHGLRGSGAQQSVYSGLDDDARARGYIVAAPDSSADSLGWGLPGLFGPDDSGFLGALLDELERRLCVDGRREFAAGMSMGAAMAASLVCGLDGRLAGVAPVAGVNIVPPCPRAAPTTVVAFHGTDDAIVPYAGGHPFPQGTGRLRAVADMIVLKPVEDSMAAWAETMGCRRAGAGWRGCRGGVSVALHTLRGGGHTWPGARSVPRLGTTAPLSANAVLLDAFDATPPR